MGSGGGNPLKSLGGDLLNYTVQGVTAGTVGYDKNTGKIKKGAAIKGGDELLGEITGRNMKRKALADANEKVSKAEADMRQQRDDELKKKEVLARQNSFSAQRLLSGTGSGFSNKSKVVGDPEKDFLGL